jgi:hypothetical protein
MKTAPSGAVFVSGSPRIRATFMPQTKSIAAEAAPTVWVGGHRANRFSPRSGYLLLEWLQPRCLWLGVPGRKASRLKPLPQCGLGASREPIFAAVRISTAPTVWVGGHRANRFSPRSGYLLLESLQPRCLWLGVPGRKASRLKPLPQCGLGASREPIFAAVRISTAPTVGVGGHRANRFSPWIVDLLWEWLQPRCSRMGFI